MSYKIIYTKSYIRRSARFIKKHPELLGQYEKTLKLLELDPFHPSLRLHKLKGKLSELYSVSINIGYRISIEFFLNEKTIIPVNVGSHEDVYD
jgi:mRNA-degrading endonuclease YafQ of YafQ-DinJ toxin-antitoxin module